MEELLIAASQFSSSPQKIPKPMKQRILSLACLISLAGLGALYARTWTDVDGRKIEASFVEALPGAVKIKLDKNGQEFEVPLERLSEEDQAWIQQKIQPAKEEDAAEEADDVQFRRGGRSRHDVPSDEEKPPNWDDAWPEVAQVDISVPIVVMEEDADKKRYVYASPHYKFISDVPLSKTVVSNFSVFFEATHEYCRLLPINLQRPRRDTGKVLYEILLYETKESYFEAGGPVGSAGMFSSRTNQIAVPLTSLGVKKVGSRYMLDRKVSNGTLAHEITHQLTDSFYYASGARGWFTEGLAEYVSNTNYRSGRFSIKNNMRSVRDRMIEYDYDAQDGRNLGEEFSAPDLKKYMLQSYRSFTGRNSNLNYGFGCLLTYYFLHFDDGGSRANITAFLKALRAGEEGEDALKHLLAGRSFDELEESVAKEWKKRGVKITFN